MKKTADSSQVVVVAKMKRGYAQTRLGQIHFASAGQQENATLLLLPPAGRTWPVFADVADKLSAKYRVIAIDYPGSGGSDPFPPDTSIEEIAGAIVDLMDELCISRAHLYGIHAGNKIATALAARWPERLYSLVLAGQSHSIVPSNIKRLGTVGKEKVKLLTDADEREAALVHWADVFSGISKIWWSERLMRSIANYQVRAKTTQRVVDDVQSSESIPHFYRANRSYDLEGDLLRIKTPTLILEIATPHEDQTVGRQGPALLKIVTGSKLVTMMEENFHGITLEDKTDELANILNDFLTCQSR